VVPGVENGAENAGVRGSADHALNILLISSQKARGMRGLRWLFFSRVLISVRGSSMLVGRFWSTSPERLLGEIIMQWTAPAFEEICLNCEINSYASAKL
jgi:coenzyme PQQ precursor peptide PqqA